MNIIPVCATVSDVQQVVIGESQFEPNGEVTRVFTGGFTTDPLAKFGESVFKIQVSEHKGENVLLSPVGLHTALSLLSNGASGYTHEKLLQVLGFGEKEQDYINWYNNKVINILNKDTTMSIYNSVWTNGSISKNFQKVAEDKYLATAAQIPFNKNGVKIINKWVKDKSNGLIPKILEGFDSNTEMLIINTSLFDGSWKNPGTSWKNSEFITNGGKKCVDFIKIYGSLIELNGAKGFAKQYEGGYYFVGILPEGDIYEFIENFDFVKLNRKLNHILQDGTEEDCRVYIPTFNLKSKTNLKQTFKNLGCNSLFHYTIELGGLLENPQELCVSTLLQSNCITFNKDGTKAASATLIEIVSYGNDPYILFNRPFVYFIVRDGIIVYAGLLNDPDPASALTN